MSLELGGQLAAGGGARGRVAVSPQSAEVTAAIQEFVVGRRGRSQVDLRRKLHRHPELGYGEFRTTREIALRLERAGLHPQTILTRDEAAARVDALGLDPRAVPARRGRHDGVGVVCDVGDGDGPMVVVRCDIDALPIADTKDDRR